MNVKFTQSEWYLPHFAGEPTANPITGKVGQCKCGYVLCDNYMGAIATVHYATDENEGDDPPLEEAKANARLICAAPDLYAALSTVLPVIEREGWFTPAQREQFRAALTKAEKGPQ